MMEQISPRTVTACVDHVNDICGVLERALEKRGINEI